jgi:chaperonin GroEL
MSKQILYGDEAKKKLKAGVDKVANAVKVTLGPRGRNVVMSKSFGGPTISNDGVSIAKEIELKDAIENMGAEIVKEVASKTDDNAGDGTTTSVVLTQAIVAEGLKRTTMGVNAMRLRSGIEQAAQDAISELKKMAKAIKSDSEIKQVATISAESAEMGEIIADTIKTVGKDGVVTVEESQSVGIDKEVVEGLEFDKGYVSPYMITNTDRMEAEYKDVKILLTDKKISSVKEVLPLLEKLAESGTKDLVIIADDVEGEALTTFVFNKLRGGFNVLAIKAPGYGDRKKEMLGDIAVTIGAKVVSDEIGLKLDAAGLDVLGVARKVVSTKDKTIIVGGKGKKVDIQSRVVQLKKQAENTSSKFDLEKLEERIAKLSGGVAVIKVGAPTETEIKYLKLKIEDAVKSTKAAIEEGIVPGGGVALVNVANALKKNLNKKHDEFSLGYGIIIKALEEPLKQIAKNAGNEESSVILNEVSKGKGYDALKNEIIPNMLSAGIVDPVKVTRNAIQNSASVAAMFLTTEVTVSDEPKDEPEPAPMAPPGMPGMM